MRVLLLLATFASACGLDDALDHKACTNNDDCWTNQDCVNPSGQREEGLCLTKGSDCVVGEQLGCDCDASNQCNGSHGLEAQIQDGMCECVRQGSGGSSG